MNAKRETQNAKRTFIVSRFSFFVLFFFATAAQATPFPHINYWTWSCPRTMVAGSRAFCRATPRPGFTFTVDPLTSIFTADANYTPANGDVINPESVGGSLPTGMFGMVSFYEANYVVCGVSGQTFTLREGTYGNFFPPQPCTGNPVTVTDAGSGTLYATLYLPNTQYYLDSDPTGYPPGTTFAYKAPISTQDCGQPSPTSGGKPYTTGSYGGYMCIAPTIPSGATPGDYTTHVTFCQTNASMNCTTFDWPITVVAPPSIPYAPPASFTPPTGKKAWEQVMVARPCPGSVCGSGTPTDPTTISGPANFCDPLASPSPVNGLGLATHSGVSMYGWNLIFDDIAIYTGNPVYRTGCFADGLNHAGNGAASTLVGAIDSTATTLTLASGSTFTNNMLIDIDGETIRCAVLTGNVFSGCVRGVFNGQKGAASHSDGAAVTMSYYSLYSVKYGLTHATPPGNAASYMHFAEPLFRACRVFNDTSFCSAGLLLKLITSIGPILDWGNLRPLAFELQDAVAFHKYANVDAPYWADTRDALYSLVQRATESDASGARFNQQQYQLGLAAYAIIEDWQVSHDPRAPWALKRIADRVWADYDKSNHWYMNLEGPENSPWCSSKSYWFQNGDNTGNCGNDEPLPYPTIGWQSLQSMMVEAFWWYYVYTGDTAYRDEGDDLFNHIFDHMDNAAYYSPTGKMDSEIYYTLFNAVGWRSGTLNLNQWYGDDASMSVPFNPTTAVASAAFNPVVYPNPWRSDKHAGKQITFGQLVSGGTIKIFTTSGHKVKEIPVTSSTMPWNLDNDKGDKVASGIYVYLITDGQGNKAKGKVAVIK